MCPTRCAYFQVTLGASLNHLFTVDGIMAESIVDLGTYIWAFYRGLTGYCMCKYRNQSLSKALCTSPSN
ncbi:hypothetical protein NEOLEDRAFT_1137315 [Neolentinus lepideus HHB14362 ss-1]|uniref:Uncharacterized protein n=1 Tax=Neolentinus lepideus HHB14362 ss-1 TaxID=1314782 RepID=A0A165QVX0_9AGAM|nr:hypothetical protein NEOLEDRAFT_1137315 [Neolentinus lepideus HHB14362 ss-1]